MGWDKKELEALPAKGGVIMAGDDRLETYSEDSMMRGRPDAVLVARDEQEVAEAMAWCNAKLIPVTLCGSQTSMTGASVPMEGLVISTEKLEGLVDIYSDGDRNFAVVRPGTVVADFQRAVADAGFFYPVAPTSRDECRIGSNVVTNATGEDSHKYGPARPHVKGVELILPSGERRILERQAGEKPSWDRNRAGYFVGWKNPIDLIIGSEGTLGFVSRATFELLPASRDFFSALIPLPSNDVALRLVVEIAQRRRDISPRTLEFIDGNALEVMRTADGFPAIPGEARAFLYIKQEFEGDSDRDRQLELWYEAALPFAGRALADNILIASTFKERENFRLWRHHIPETENETGRKFWADGGGKVGSDWWVPIDRLLEMMKFFYETVGATGLSHIAYAHIGAGHPHTNIQTRNAKEKAIALDALRACCRRAVELGGGVAGEHGIGKIHTDLVPIQHSSAIIEQMRKWKSEYDPNWILGRGNIFERKP
ncbi:MAG: FAD-binding oxidoreductase [Pseudomonadota bacterium]